MAASLGKMPTTSVRRLIAALDLFQRIGRTDLQAIRFGKGHVRQDVGLVHERTDLREALSELIGDRTPLSTRIGLAFLVEDGADGLAATGRRRLCTAHARTGCSRDPFATGERLQKRRNLHPAFPGENQR